MFSQFTKRACLGELLASGVSGSGSFESKGWSHMMARREVVEVKNFQTPEKTSAAIFNELRSDLAEWMTTDKDRVWRPVAEITQEGNEFAVRALVPGVDPADIQVLVAPDTLL